MRRASYKEAIAWIAQNDDPGSDLLGRINLDYELIEGQISVGLIADIFGVTTDKVARDVIKFRQKEEMRSL